MAHGFVHIELNSANPDQAKTFYAGLFNWQLQDISNPAVSDSTYTVIRTEQGTGGGIMQQVPGGPNGWIPYVQVDDLRAATDKAKALGGKVMKDVTEVPQMGWFSIVQDPTGAVLGLWENERKTARADGVVERNAESSPDSDRTTH
jgi:uncharacterized protein